MTQYRNKKTGKVGTVVHYKGVTTTLQFEDGTELILSRYALRNEWQRVKNEELDSLLGKENRVSFEEFVKIMKEHNSSDNKNALEGIIVYSQKNFNTKYPEVSRSYKVTSDNPLFKGTGKELVGDCLDKSEFDISLDLYDWKVDYCYFTAYYAG